MRKLLCCWVVLTILLANQIANAQTNEKWGLRRCVEYALTNNVSVRQADIQARLSAIALKLFR